MSVPDSEAQAQQQLLAVVERYREEQCAALLARANDQARELVRQGYAEARARGRRGVAEVRLHCRNRIAAAQARQQTRMRQQRHHDNSALLASLWEQLRGSILSRWQEPGARRAWIDALLRTAAASLLDSSWTIEHPVDWPQAEQHALRSRVGEASVSFAPQAGMAAGLRICAGGACVDGSADGLLKDRAYIESLLLAALHEHCSEEHSDCPSL
jgi:hypothetical protein